MDVSKMIFETAREVKALAFDLRTAEQAYQARRAVLESSFPPESSPSGFPELYWRIVGIHDGIRKFREFCEGPIVSMDSMLLAQTARYLFEATLWIKFLSNPTKNAQSYYEYLLHKKRDHYQELTSYFADEASQLDLTQKAFELVLRKRAAADHSLGTRMTKDDIGQLIAEFDASRNYRFSIFRRFSTGNYASYATHIREDTLSLYAEDLELINQQVLDLEAVLNRKITQPPKTSRFAELVGMKSEYNFVFKLTSKHLHATPLSMSTDMKEISEQEALIFLEYIRAKGRDVLSHSLYLMLDYKRAPSIVGLGRHFCATRRRPRRRSLYTNCRSQHG